MFPNPLFVIAFVSIRFSFLQSSQIYSKFWVDKKNSLKVFPRISLQILKIVGQSSQVEKSRRIVQTNSVEKSFPAEKSSRESQARKSKLSWNKILLCQNRVSVRKSFQWTQNSLNILIIRNLPWFLNLMLTADAMASAGINCCSTVCQHKCM